MSINSKLNEFDAFAKEDPDYENIRNDIARIRATAYNASQQSQSLSATEGTFLQAPRPGDLTTTSEAYVIARKEAKNLEILKLRRKLAALQGGNQE